MKTKKPAGKQAKGLLISTDVLSKKGTSKGLRQQEFLNHYPEHNFNMSATCRTIGLSRRTVGKWTQFDSNFQEQLDELKESRIDFVESELYKQAISGNIIAVIFFLKCQGKHRGYIELPNATQRVELKTVHTQEEKDKIVAAAIQQTQANQKYAPLWETQDNDTTEH